LGSYLDYQRVKQLIFFYRIQPGDAAIALDYNGSTALIHDNVIMESLNTSINFNLPSSDLPTEIVIDTTPPCKF
jgi:hypothetical protein